MKKQAIFDIALKIIGILLLKNALVSAVAIVTSLSIYFQDQGDYPFSTTALLRSTILGLLIYLLLGILFLKYSNVLATKLLKGGEDLDIALPDDWERRVLSIALKIVGVVCLTNGIAGICPHLWDWSRSGSKYIFFSTPNFATSLTNVAIGIYLLLGGGFLVRIAYQKRKKKDIEEEWECSECGAIISADAIVCPKCGADVREIEEEK